MFYVRFLSVPKVVSPSGQRRRTIRFVIAITTDLGDAFYASNTALRATVTDQEARTITSRQLDWPAKARALPTELSFNHVGPVPLLRVWVTPLEGAALTRLDGSTLPAIVGIGSALLRWDHGLADAYVERRLDLGDSVPDLCIGEETGDSIARHIWDGGVGLVACLKHLAHSNEGSLSGAILRDRLQSGPSVVRAIELGAGCGTVGIALAQLIPRIDVLLTDLPEAMEVLSQNVKRARPASGSSVEAAVLDWEGHGLDVIQDQTFDLIIISECTYNADSIPSLVHMLVGLMKTSPEALVLLSTKVRHESEATFFDLVAEAGLATVHQAAIDLPPSEGTWRMVGQVDIYVLQASSAGRLK